MAAAIDLVVPRFLECRARAWHGMAWLLLPLAAQQHMHCSGGHGSFLAATLVGTHGGTCGRACKMLAGAELEGLHRLKRGLGVHGECFSAQPFSELHAVASTLHRAVMVMHLHWATALGLELS